MEQELFFQEDLKPSSQEILLRQIRDIRNYQVKSTSTFLLPDAKKLKSSIEEIKTFVTSLLELLLEEDDDEFSKKRSVEKQFKKVLYLVSGVTIIAFDTSIATTQPIVSAISVTFGGNIISKHL